MLGTGDVKDRLPEGYVRRPTGSGYWLKFTRMTKGTKPYTSIDLLVVRTVSLMGEDSLEFVMANNFNASSFGGSGCSWKQLVTNSNMYFKAVEPLAFSLPLAPLRAPKPVPKPAALTPVIVAEGAAEPEFDPEDLEPYDMPEGESQELSSSP